MERIELQYFYGQEAEQFTFYRLPKILITDPKYKTLSDSAKILYGLMLDRMSLSMRNGWVDDENRVYIKYSFANILEDLNCAKEKASRVLKELEDIGLIVRIARIGRASVIYVMNFVVSKNRPSKTEQDEEICANGESDSKETVNAERTSSLSVPVRKTEQFEKQMPRSSEIEQSMVRLSNPNNNKQNHTDLSETNLINQQSSSDEMDAITVYRNLIKQNIDYDILIQDKDRGELYEELFQIICDVVCIPRSSIRIGGEEYPYQLVASKFIKLNSFHLQYVADCFWRNSSKISNIRSYLLTALYNAPNTMNHYYTAEVNHDMRGVGGVDRVV